MSLISAESLRFVRSLSLGFITSLSLSSLSLAIPKTSQPRTVVFNSISQQGKTNGLFTISTNGTNRRKLAASLNQGINAPVWSPNGQRLVFTANGDQDIYVVNADGSKLTKVLSEEYCKGLSWSLTWSANSQNLVLTRSCDGSTSDAPGSVALYLSNTKSTKLIRQWQIGGIPPVSEIASIVYPAPNGNQVSFIRDQNLYKMNSDGSGLTQLTQVNAKPGEPKLDGTQLYWSPDSTRIARMDFFFGNTLAQRISILSAKGELLGQWSNRGTNWSNPNLIWSPDGRRVAYYQTEPSSNDQFQQTIYLYDLADKTPKDLTRKPGEYNGLAWSPDGQQITFTFKSTGGTKLYTVSIQNSQWTELTPQKGIAEVSSPAWSPDSQQIVFTAGTVENNSLYIVNRNGSGLKRLTVDRNVFIANPSWRP